MSKLKLPWQVAVIGMAFLFIVANELEKRTSYEHPQQINAVSTTEEIILGEMTSCEAHLGPASIDIEVSASVDWSVRPTVKRSLQTAADVCREAALAIVRNGTGLEVTELCADTARVAAEYADALAMSLSEPYPHNSKIWRIAKKQYRQSYYICMGTIAERPYLD